MALPDAMAEMIPDTLRASSTAGEKRVFAMLARLPDDCLIYYEPVVRRRYPDLIAILPEVGVLVIEVKDWWLAELGSVNADTVTITRRGTATVVPHPRRQARQRQRTRWCPLSGQTCRADHGEAGPQSLSRWKIGPVVVHPPLENPASLTAIDSSSMPHGGQIEPCALRHCAVYTGVRDLALTRMRATEIIKVCHEP
jgi:nuclease-like protein